MLLKEFKYALEADSGSGEVEHIFPSVNISPNTEDHKEEKGELLFLRNLQKPKKSQCGESSACGVTERTEGL